MAIPAVSLPKLKRDWTGRYVRLRVSLRTHGGTVFAAGEVLVVLGYYRGLELRTPGPDVEEHWRWISRVPCADVELLPTDYQPAIAPVAEARPAARRLLILACSARKQPTPAPALLLYDGPLYRILRGAWRDGAAEVAVWILSAEHGLIPAGRELTPYDRRMTTGRARVLAPQVRQVLDDVAGQGPYAECYVELGRDYLPALPGEEELRAILGCPVQYGQGSIGRRGGALKAWLRQGEGSG